MHTRDNKSVDVILRGGVLDGDKHTIPTEHLKRPSIAFAHLPPLDVGYDSWSKSIDGGFHDNIFYFQPRIKNGSYCFEEGRLILELAE